MAGDLTIRYASLCKESVHGRTKLFTSSRNADEQYVTTIGHEDVPANCSCPGFQFRGNCKHMTALYAERPPCVWTELEGSLRPLSRRWKEYVQSVAAKPRLFVSASEMRS